MRFLVYLSSLLIVFNCADKKKSAKSMGSTADTIQTETTTRPDQPANVSTDPAKGSRIPVSATGTWTYEKKVDKLGSTVYKASATSPTPLTFTFPYEGGSTATLSIRHKNDLTYLYLEVSRGQFNRTFQGGKARITFDNKGLKTYSFSAAENGRANIIFFDEVAKLVAQMKASRNMRIDVDFYAQGKRSIEFNTANLVWNH